MPYHGYGSIQAQVMCPNDLPTLLYVMYTNLLNYIIYMYVCMYVWMDGWIDGCT